MTGVSYIKSCSSDINGQIAHWQDALKALISLNKEHQQEVEATKKRRVTTVKLIQPTIENFRRNKKGQKLIAQELSRLLTDQSRWFPLKPMASMDGTKVRFSHQGQVKEISKSELCAKASSFFSCYFGDIRNKLNYGAKVHGWLTEVKKGMEVDMSDAKLNSLIGEIANFKAPELQGFEESLGESD